MAPILLRRPLVAEVLDMGSQGEKTPVGSEGSSPIPGTSRDSGDPVRGSSGGTGGGGAGGRGGPGGGACGSSSSCGGPPGGRERRENMTMMILMITIQTRNQEKIQLPNASHGSTQPGRSQVVRSSNILNQVC